MVDFKQSEHYTVADLVTITEILRGKDGCPWDKEQDHHTVRKNFLEETYEVLEAIDNNDTALLREELGDVLLQVVFHAQLEKESGSFNFDDVASDICKKLIKRHPHVFGDVKLANGEDVLNNWEHIKQTDKGQESALETLESVPKTLPALMRSSKLGARAARAGTDCPDVVSAVDDFEAQFQRLRQAFADGTDDTENALGDSLFAFVGIARKLSIDPEESLQKACNRFIADFGQGK